MKVMNFQESGAGTSRGDLGAVSPVGSLCVQAVTTW